MTLIFSDIDFQNEAFRIFDGYSGRSVGEQLGILANHPLLSADDVMDRQAIIRSMSPYADSVKKSTGYRSEFEAVSANTKDIHQRYPFLQKNSSLLDNLISRKQHERLRAEVVQFLLVIKKIRHCYFTDFKIGNFPSSYQAELKALIDMIAEFDHFPDHEQLVNGTAATGRYSRIGRLIANKAVIQQWPLFWSSFFRFEAFMLVSFTAARKGFAFPVFSEQGIVINDLFHPLLANPVKNSINISGNVVILTGPNMSGKSTLLKSLSLCVYLAHIGFPVPAAAASMPFFSSMGISLYARDRLDGLSHFMTEVKNLKNVLLEASQEKAVFSVFDELFSGTNVDDAMRLFEKTVKGLHRYPRSIFIISTHLHFSDTTLSDPGIQAFYLDAKVVNDKPSFSYQLKPGCSTYHFGAMLFRNEGLDDLLK